jgi:hypothetical protein
VTAVVRERKQVVAALLVEHPHVLDVVDPAVVVGRNQLQRRVRQRRDVAAAVLIRILRVALQRDVSQRAQARGAPERLGRRVDRLLGRRPWHRALGGCLSGHTGASPHADGPDGHNHESDNDKCSTHVPLPIGALFRVTREDYRPSPPCVH